MPFKPKIRRLAILILRPRRVGGEADEKFSKVTPYPLESLQDVFSFDELAGL